ncbi:MAG: type I-E CRISPR-associated protein Cas7/Cse4/CasC [Solirubrobacteraceae bacterium]|nr:type I-E CRISPR-associated protein Cas7/Cse4/CasC [Solirubrobacteraceae bacterium]
MILELHAIQSFAPANLNRDDTGRPKECVFGGVRRARVSSQSWKRAIREQFRSEVSGLTVATRTKRAHEQVVARLIDGHGLSPEVAIHRAAVVLEAEPLGLSLKQSEGDADARVVKTGQLVFFRAHDLDTLAAVAVEFGDEIDAITSTLTEAPADNPAKAKRTKAKLPKPATAQITSALTAPSDAVDVALFGRMVAEMPESNVDAACQVAHAIGTHRLADEVDYFTAVDDLRPDDTEGADMIGDIQFNASCFYRYAVLDVGQLAVNLGADDASDPIVDAAVEAFTEGFVTAIPSGKQNSFAARNPPTTVLAVRRQRGAWNLANAFAAPVPPFGTDSAGNEGVAIESSRRMIEEFAVLNATYGRAKDELASVVLSTLAPGIEGDVARAPDLDSLIAHARGRA